MNSKKQEKHKKMSFKRFLNSVKYSIEGLNHAYKNEQSLWLHGGGVFLAVILGITLKINFYNSTNSNGDSNISEAFNNCESNVCHNLWNSKLYTCPICFKKYFYEYFNQTPEEIEGLDIYSLSGIEIRDGLSRPIAQCRYCSPTNPKKFKWEQSKKEITEWV